MKEITVGIIGAGYMGREHARVLRLVRPFFGDRVRLVAIVDKNKEAAERARREFEIDYATDSIDAVLSDERINTIFSCLPTVFHHDILKKVIAAGKNIFCEKPFATSLENARAMHDICAKSGIRNQVGFVLRYAPVYHAVKKILAQCAAESPLRTIILRDDQVFPVKGISHFTDWRSQRDLAGAGVLIEHGIHDIDILEWFFGHIKRVSARMSNFAGYPSIEDYLEARLEFVSGVTATLVHIWHDIAAHQSIRHFEIFFHKALVTMDTYDMHHVTVRDNTAEHTFERADLYHMIAYEPLFKDIAHREDLVYQSDYYACQDYWFLRNLLEDKPLSPTMVHGLRAFTIVDACYASARQDGTWVSTE